MEIELSFGAPKLEKAYIAPAPGGPGGAGGLLSGLGSMAGGALGGAMGAAAGAAVGAMGDALLGIGGPAGQVDFKFNPKEYTIQKSANWQRKPAKGAQQAALPEFTGSNPKTLTLEIFLDSSESSSGSVVQDVDTLFSYCTPSTQSMGMNKPCPPFVIFGWGSTVSFKAFVKSVSAKYTMFRQDGTPTRAVCNVTLEEVSVPTPGQNPTSGGLAARRTHTVIVGDSLASIAYREYRDPSMWRAIAQANDIDDPMRIPAGTRLLVPPPAEVSQPA